jgi:hypothetical protein
MPQSLESDRIKTLREKIASWLGMFADTSSSRTTKSLPSHQPPSSPKDERSCSGQESVNISDWRPIDIRDFRDTSTAVTVTAFDAAELPRKATADESAGRKSNVSPNAVPNERLNKLLAMSCEELFQHGASGTGDIVFLAEVCESLRRNLPNWLRTKPDSWRGAEVIRNIEDRFIKTVQAHECMSQPAATSEAHRRHDIAWWAYVRLIERLSYKWDDLIGLQVIKQDFHAMVSQRSDIFPDGWCGEFELKWIGHRIAELLGRKRMVLPPGTALPPVGGASAPSAASKSGPPGVPVWPKEAMKTASVALASEQFAYTDGVLSYMGYRVGRNSTLTIKRRRRILDYVVLGQLPQVNDRHYMQEWGRPKSSKRLRKTANALASFARSARRNRNADKSIAISRWEEDLEYLRERYYRSAFSWAWPRTTR